MNKQVIDYIKKMREAGYADDGIKGLLLNAGHKEDDIQAAFDSVSGGVNPQSGNVVPMPPIPVRQKELISFGELLSKTWAICKSKFWALTGIFILPMIWFLIAGLLLDLIGESAFIPWLISGFVGYVLFFCSFLALIYEIKDGGGIVASYRSAFSKILKYIWVVILSTLMIWGGSLVFFIPGVILGFWFVFSPYVLVSENKGGLGALLRSKEYYKGYGWPIFVMLIMFMLLMSGISIGFFIGMAVLAFIFSLVNELIGGLVIFILYMVLMISLMQLALIYQYLLYKSLVDLKPELSNTPPVGKRWVYVIFAILGLVSVAVWIFLMFSFNEAGPQQLLSRDTVRIANMESVRTYLIDGYNVKCGHFPGVIDNIKPECSSPEANNDWTELTRAMATAGITFKLPNDPIPNRNYFYGVGKSDGFRFVVGATLEKDSNKLRNDIDGMVYGVDCNDPVYCVSSD